MARARLNGAVYYYDYEDYQAFSIFNLTPQVTNSDAESKGGELEFSVTPATGLDFVLGAAYIDSNRRCSPGRVWRHDNGRRLPDRT